METLDYQRDPSGFRWTRRSTLTALAIAATVLTIYFNLYWFDEPFGTFRFADAFVLVGIPVAVIGLWAAWFALALRRPRVRVHAFVLVAAACWVMLTLVMAYASITRYLFREPWTQYP